MTFSPPSSVRLPSRLLILGFVSIAIAAVAPGCADNHVGRPCDIGVPKSQIDAMKVTVNPAALECPSRICLLPAVGGAPVMNVGGLCTVECSTDDDCADGETAKAGPSNVRCTTGFVCRTLLPNLASTPGLSCKPLCVCKDFLSSADALKNNKPTGCP